ncbi:MAG: putative prohead protease [Prokaryotic dsDNA virus sp.]|nr:MAG: putative prohead protease [Prokaryotic dsDNA virus sp.]|tara:strand:- start:1031 stop:1705 length:675 start_codon:yes stop_codon:yes gene_type:complete
MELIYKQSPLGEVQDIDSKNGIVKGYASYFENKDSDNDIIKRGAYKKTIEENGYRVKYYYQHKLDQPLGKMRELYEDEKGLMFVAEIPKTTLGNDVLELMKNGIITENSVGIMPIQKEIKEGYRELTEVKLYEVSAVSLASNDQAKILDVKGMKNFDDVYKRYDNLCKLIRKGNISDEMGYALEAEILKLKGFFTDLTTQPAEATEPEVKNDSSAYRLLIDKLK